MPSKKDDDLIQGPSSQQADHSQKCKETAARLRAGMTCPICHQAQLDYDGMLQLICPRCGVLETGTFT
ncbi:MAG: hypothetical protein K0B06_07355 [Brevefilum sp.]|nr:hypothetical protein [Brevefilum sp.]